MDAQLMRENLSAVRSKREVLVELSGRPDLSEALRLDIRQALEELDDLVLEFDKTFPN
jgi:hypothetical protein